MGKDDAGELSARITIERRCCPIVRV